ncbi:MULTISPECIES: hypothetical protein [unclassified Streptomyces]|nr:MULTISPECIES: hypothetical protein [unclassified Streptomyces]
MARYSVDRDAPHRAAVRDAPSAAPVRQAVAGRFAGMVTKGGRAPGA